MAHLSHLFGSVLLEFQQVIDLLYAFLFSVELVLKITVDGRRFFCTRDHSALFWNYLDLIIVCASCVELVFDILLLAQMGSENRIVPTNLLRVIRIVRILRVMRVIKVVKFISGLTSLISSILSTLKSLLWSLVLLLMVIYVCLATQK